MKIELTKKESGMVTYDVNLGCPNDANSTFEMVPVPLPHDNVISPPSSTEPARKSPGQRGGRGWPDIGVILSGARFSVTAIGGIERSVSWDPRLCDSAYTSAGDHPDATAAEPPGAFGESQRRSPTRMSRISPLKRWSYTIGFSLMVPSQGPPAAVDMLCTVPST